jgi:hypothetical protein
LAIITIFLYTNYIVIAGVVLCANCAVIANINICDKEKVWVKEFTNACYKGEEGVIKGITCFKNKEVTSLIKVKLRQF